MTVQRIDNVLIVVDDLEAAVVSDERTGLTDVPNPAIYRTTIYRQA